MAVERIELISDQEKTAINIRASIQDGTINKDNFDQLDEKTQSVVKDILFTMSTEKIDSSEGASTLEFILMAFIRIANKKMNGRSLNSEDVKIEEALNTILQMHEITNGTPRKKWLFDYMGYAQYKTMQFLNNRKEHIIRKMKVTGKV